jgi:hypothetical protein
MKRMLSIALAALLIAGCQEFPLPADHLDDVAVDLAVATIAADRSPAPTPPQPYKCRRCQDTGWVTHGDGHRTPCPDCRAGAAGPYGGPLDTLRDAKDLIRKGTELADRSKALLDAAERDGKITVDVHLPDPNVSASGPSCPSGVCLVPPAVEQKPAIARQSAVRQDCANGVFRPRLFWRLRR